MTETERQIYMAQQIHRAVQFTLLGQELDDEQAMEVADIYPGWEINKNYKTNMIVKYGKNEDNETQLWKVLQDHTSQADWTPDKAVSLFKKIGYDDQGIAIWTQPYGASDAYAKGDKVKHKDKVWVSDVDGNVWEPGVYGWSEVK